jgi:hypothetical protein
VKSERLDRPPGSICGGCFLSVIDDAIACIPQPIRTSLLDPRRPHFDISLGFDPNQARLRCLIFEGPVDSLMPSECA